MKMTRKRNKGITLVALVVTVIILLILAGISIASLTGNGLFEKAKLAKEKQENAEHKEEIILSDYENKIAEQYNKQTNEETNKAVTEYADGLEYYYDMTSKADYAAIFNGTQYLYTDNLGEKYVGTNSKTLSCWFKTSEVESNLNCFTGMGTDSPKTAYFCGIKNGYLYFDTGYGNFCRSDQDWVADNKWHYFAVTYSKDTLTLNLYLDGNNIYQVTGNIDTQNAPLMIGCGCAGKYCFNGEISRVNLYNKELNVSEIIKNYNMGAYNSSVSAVTSELQYELIMKNKSNGIVIDSANNHAVYENGTVKYASALVNLCGDEYIDVDSTIIQNVDGRNCLNFYDNNLYYCTKNLDPKYLGENSKTLSCWFKTSDKNDSLKCFVGIGIDAPKAGFFCGVKSGYLYFDTGYKNLCREGQDWVADDKWHCFLASYDGSNKKIEVYLDGNKVYNNFGEIDTQEAGLVVGKSPSQYLFNGLVSNVRLYAKYLDENMVAGIYNEEKN